MHGYVTVSPCKIKKQNSQYATWVLKLGFRAATLDIHLHQNRDELIFPELVNKHSIQLSKQHTSQIQQSFSLNRAIMNESCKKHIYQHNFESKYLSQYPTIFIDLKFNMTSMKGSIQSISWF
jgi:hypothetical protein